MSKNDPRERLRKAVERIDGGDDSEDAYTELADAKAELDDHMKAVAEAKARQADVLAARKAIEDAPRPEVLEKADPSGSLLPVVGLRKPARTPGEQFGDAIKGYLKHFPSGRIPEGSAIVTPIVPITGKDLLTSYDRGTGPQAGVFIQPDYQGLQGPGFDRFFRPVSVLDLVSRVTTTSDLIHWTRIASITTDPGYITQATSVSDAAALITQEAAITWTTDTIPVVDLGEGFTVTETALADVGGYLEGLINQILGRGMVQKVERELLFGSGATGQMRGLYNWSGVLLQGYSGDLFDTVRKAKTTLRTTSRTVPNAVLLNPADVERLDLLRDGNERFFGAGPFADTNPPLWGVPRIESELIPEGEALMGDFSKLFLIDRQQTSVQATNQHADYFMRRLVQVRATWRGAVACYDPAAFIRIDLSDTNGIS